MYLSREEVSRRIDIECSMPKLRCTYNNELFPKSMGDVAFQDMFHLHLKQA